MSFWQKGQIYWQMWRWLSWKERVWAWQKFWAERAIRHSEKTISHLPSLFVQKNAAMRAWLSNGARISPVAKGLCQLETENLRILIRPQSTDWLVLDYVFRQPLYEPVVRWAKGVGWQPRTIVDLGAYTGFSVLFWRQHFPEALIWAIEPEAQNFELLQRNLALNPTGKGVVCHQAALWQHDTQLTFTQPPNPEQAWALQLTPADELPTRAHSQVVAGWSVRLLREMMENRPIDLLKINIEGAEAWILQDPDFQQFILPNLQVLVFEWHSGTDFNLSVFRKMTEAHFQLVSKGRWHFAFRQNNRI